MKRKFSNLLYRLANQLESFLKTATNFDVANLTDVRELQDVLCAKLEEAYKEKIDLRKEDTTFYRIKSYPAEVYIDSKGLSGVAHLHKFVALNLAGNDKAILKEEGGKWLQKILMRILSGRDFSKVRNPKALIKDIKNLPDYVSFFSARSKAPLTTCYDYAKEIKGDPQKLGFWGRRRKAIGLSRKIPESLNI